MTGKSKVLENSFFYMFSSLLVKAIGFFLLPVYTYFLTPEDYGITNLVNGFNSVATFIVAFSLYQAVMRFYVDYKNDREKLKRFYGSVTCFVFLSSLVFLLVSIAVNELIVSLFFEGVDFFPVVLIALVTLCFLSVHSVHQSMLQGMQKGKKLTLINIVVFLIQVALNLVMIGVLRMGAVGVLLAALIVNVGYMVFMLIDVRRNDLMEFCLDKRLLKEALKYSIPIMPHNLSTHIASFASRIFINREGSLGAVGLYGVAMQFGALVDIVQVSVNKAFAPWFYDVMNRRDKEAKEEILEMSRLLLILYSLVYLVIGLFSQEVVILMTNEKYTLAWTAIPILVVGYSIKSIYYFYVNILFFHKEAARRIFIATVSGSLADILFAAILVPLAGMYGAAIAFLIAKVIVVSIVVFMARKYNDIGYRLVDMLKTILPSFLFIGFGLFFSYTRYINEFSMFNLIFKLAVLGAYILFIYLTNIRIFRGLGKRLLVLRRKHIRGTGKD